MKLKDKVAVIAGGTKGIGLGIALEFVSEGARVVIGGTTDETGQEGVREIEAAGGEGLFVKCDVASLTDLDGMIERVVERFGRRLSSMTGSWVSTSEVCSLGDSWLRAR